jgi:hypothetical protein
MLIRVGLTLCVLVVCTAGVAAQDTRTALIASQQAAKAKAMAPPQLTKSELIADWIQQRILTERPHGIIPYFDSVYGGGGLTLGAGYRQAFADHSLWIVRGLYSAKQYKLIEFDVVSSIHPKERVTVGATVGWRDATQVGFYGLGMDTRQSDRADFRFQQAYAQVTGMWRPSPWFRASATGGFEDYSLKDPTGKRQSVSDAYTPQTAPGLGDSPSFLHTDLRLGLDTRTTPGYSRVGSYLGGGLVSYVDPDHTYSFNLADLEGVQHIPLLRETWVVSLRARVQTTVDDDDVVPYFLMPALGSSSTLRAFSSRRFRDRHSLLASGEFRWIPNRLGLDMALFYDAGKVTSRRADLNFSGLEHNAGIGLRLHGPSLTMIRIELARGSEGWNTVFASSAAF